MSTFPVELLYATRVDGKKEGAFTAITAHAKLYGDYESQGMSAEDKAKFYPVVLMVQRWDGKLGFPGGFRDGDESLFECAQRELLEEVGFALTSDHRVAPLCAHELGTVVVNLHHLHLGQVEVDVLKNILLGALQAPHAFAEGIATWVHLADYGRGKGLQTVLGSNTLASAVKEELEIVLKRI